MPPWLLRLSAACCLAHTTAAHSSLSLLSSLLSSLHTALLFLKVSNAEKNFHGIETKDRYEPC
jgi:hypothetical protein